jgi:hypothetical protein
MPIPPFEKVQVADFALSRVQDNLKRPLDVLTKLEVLDGQLLTGVELASGLNNLEHKLGRTLRGYWLTRANADVRVWDDATTSAAPNLFHRLQASAAATVSLWVY